MLDEDLLARPSGTGEASLSGEPVLNALSPAVESFLPSVITPSKEVRFSAQVLAFVPPSILLFLFLFLCYNNTS